VTDLVKGNPLIAGVTFSGGEPMCQAAALFCVASRVKEAGLGIALYTGYTLESLLTENDRDRIRLLELCDVLVDGRYEEDKRYPAQAFKGSSNQRVLDVQQSLGKRRAILAAAPEWGNAMA
jgi:anaerobic ribonucleoside-triphosphate reductase activating protein